MSDKGTTRLIAEHLGALLGSLSKLLDETLLLRLGWYVDALPPQYGAVAQSAASLAAAAEALASGGADDLNQIKQVLDQTAALYGAVKALPQVQPLPQGVDPTVFAAEFLERVTNIVITDYLSAKLPSLYHALVMLGVVVQEFHPAVPEAPGQVPRPPRLDKRIDYSALADTLTNPASIPARAYKWGDPDFRFERVAAPLIELLTAAGMVAGFEIVDPLLRDALFPSPDPRNTITRIAYVSFFNGPVLGVPVDLGIAIHDLPADATHPLPGLIVHPRFPDIQQSIQVGANTSVTATGGIDFTQSFALLVRPEQTPEVRFPFVGGSVPSAGVTLSLDFSPPEPSVLLGRKGATRLEVKGATLRAFIGNAGTNLEVAAEARAIELKVVVVPSDADSFVGALVGSNAFEIDFPIGIRWSNVSGFSFIASGGFEISTTPNISFGPFHIQRLMLKMVGGADQGAPAIRAFGSADLDAKLGPVTATVQEIGVALDFRFREGNVGPFDVDVDFKPPTGVGISVNSGPVHGGGFISFDPDAGRYSGAVELSIYDISVKAFGLIETKVPGVSFSFVMVISAEFTPIQLGFGFTLTGVGGLVGINRTIASNELGKLVREGRSENLLFPKNLIANAPTIIRDLGTVFPARNDHYVFGPLGKFGWGTPTLITAQIGIILELPGPVIVILGEVKVLLPKPDVPLVKMNMSVVGTLDFPNKTFSIDAALHDSIIEGYPISGQMALRVKWGDQPNFVASIGGFHPAYQPPKEFPKLQPMAMDLGQHGNASITVSGFFAVTSNTVQVGGDARLHAGGSGITLDASVSVKALFVFSPFAFQANIDASVRISFHGYGPSVHLSGLLEGPSPWHIRGEVCVSILFWDACLGFDQTFGGGQPESIPEIDPFFGTIEVIGLQTALADAGNWSGVLPVGTANVVSRAQGSETLVDPLGGLTVHQKAVPVETDHPISRFGVAKVKTPISYKLPAAGATIGVGPTLPLTKLSPVNDFFAPAQYFQMDDGKKLSAPGFEQQQSGYVFGENANNLRAGSNAGVTLKYQTFLIAGDGTISDAPEYVAPNAHVTGLNKRSPVALGGSAQVGTRRFIDRLITQAFDVLPPTFILSNNLSLTPITGLLAAVSRSSVLLSLDAYRLQKPEERLQVQVSASHELAA